MEHPPETPAETPPETLSHERVLLRRYRPDDLDPLDQVVTESLEHLLPWMPWAANHNRDAIRDYLARAEQDWESGAAYNYAITTGGVLVGSSGLMRRIGPGGLEIGYWIHPDWTGRGLVTMTAAALTRAAFALPGTTHVEVHHDAANLASGAVPRRLGFTEVSRTADTERSAAPGETGVSVVQRIDRAGAAALLA